MDHNEYAQASATDGEIHCCCCLWPGQPSATDVETHCQDDQEEEDEDDRAPLVIN